MRLLGTLRETLSVQVKYPKIINLGTLFVLKISDMTPFTVSLFQKLNEYQRD